MIRTHLLTIASAVVAIIPLAVSADPNSDLNRAAAAFNAARSYHAVEQFSNGRTMTVDHVAPDRWRLQPDPKTNEVVIGNRFYMNGRLIPFMGGAIRAELSHFNMTITPEIQSSLRDLGWQMVNGVRTHAYSYTSSGVPETLYIGPHDLPLQAVTTSRGITTTITYSQYNAPITITP